MKITPQAFVDSLQSMEGRLANAIVKAMKESALKMQRLAAKNATTFPRVIDNNLRGSITGTVVRYQQDDYLILRAGGKTAPDRPFSEAADVVYAAIQEYGGTTDMAGGARFIKPKFYLRRARDKVQPQLEADLDRLMGRVLNGKEG